MSFRSSITVVASPRPRVGKTLLARLLAGFHLQEARSVAAFDLNTGEQTLEKFLPAKTAFATVRDINGQMALFDHLVENEDMTKMIDVGHESFETFFSVAHQIGFVEEARRRSIAVAILFIVTPGSDIREAYRNLRSRFTHATLAPVHNEMLGSAQHREKYQISSGGPVMARKCQHWRQACASTSRARHFPSPVRIWATRRYTARLPIKSCSAGYVEFISSSASSICVILLADLSSSIRFGS